MIERLSCLSLCGFYLRASHSDPRDVGRALHLLVTLRNLTAHAQTATTAESIKQAINAINQKTDAFQEACKLFVGQQH